MRTTRALGVLMAMMVITGALPGGAAAEQASQPTAAAAARQDVGRFHSCALLNSASVRCWGYGRDGALGYGNRDTVGDDETPAQAGPVALGPGRSALAVSAGSVHTCALLDNAGVSCWGFGGDGRLGYANTNIVGDDETPAAVGPVSVGGPARAITAGRGHTCAILGDGSVRCWGFGFDGRLGYGNRNSIGDDELPSAIEPVKLGAGRTATAITAGDAHSCAVLDDASVRCWGFGGNGQLPNGNTINIGDDETPDTISPARLGAGRTVKAISAGDFHTCVILDNGTVRCWGFGGNGRLGYGNTDSIGDNETPDAVGTVDLGTGRTAVAVAAGANHSCAILDNGSVRCWGFGRNGRLGYGNTNDIGDNETPGSVPPVDLGAGRTARAITAGGESTCARLDDGSLRCWGNGGNGFLGNCSPNLIGDDETPGSIRALDLESPALGCPVPAPDPVPVAPAVSAPAAPAVPAPMPTTPPVPTDDGIAAQAVRARALRTCLVGVSRQVRTLQRRARLLSAGAARTTTLSRILSRARLDRRACVRRHGRTPGRVTTLAARATGSSTIVLSFRAVGTDGAKAPAAHDYLVKQSLQPILTRRDAVRAQNLCKGRCRFKVTRIGTAITLRVTGLRSKRRHYYTVTARDNVSTQRGPRSKTVSVRTR